jgi:hypothetical protein
LALIGIATMAAYADPAVARATLAAFAALASLSTVTALSAGTTMADADTDADTFTAMATVSSVTPLRIVLCTVTKRFVDLTLCKSRLTDKDGHQNRCGRDSKYSFHNDPLSDVDHSCGVPLRHIPPTVGRIRKAPDHSSSSTTFSGVR